jgi:DNA-binding LacI/PurR family transcriptional regulator
MAASRLEGDFREIDEWMAANPGMDAILCGNANICLSALDALADLPSGRRVALATFDDLSCFRFMENPVVSVRQPTERMGLAAFEALMARIRGEAPASPVEILLPAALVLRGSQAALARGAALTNGGGQWL